MAMSQRHVLVARWPGTRGWSQQLLHSLGLLVSPHGGWDPTGTRPHGLSVLLSPFPEPPARLDLLGEHQEQLPGTAKHRETAKLNWQIPEKSGSSCLRGQQSSGAELFSHRIPEWPRLEGTLKPGPIHSPTRISFQNASGE